MDREEEDNRMSVSTENVHHTDNACKIPVKYPSRNILEAGGYMGLEL